MEMSFLMEQKINVIYIIPLLVLLHSLIYASTNILERNINYVPLVKPSFDNTSNTR
jgi:hypothetical protein